MTEEKERIYTVALAGLLHDIGKFGQRAGEAGTNGKKDHPAVGDKFVNQHIPAKWRGALAPVAWHHGDLSRERKFSELGLPVRIVALADRLSAGEREQKERDSERPQQMISIFSRIRLSNDKADHPLTYLPLARLDLSKSALFPQEKADLSNENKKQYWALWDEFCKEADAIGGVNTDLGSYLESMLHLLRRYTWSIPSAYYYAQPDVSLYEHLHTTAALSACFMQEWGDGAPNEVDALLEAIRNKETDDWPDQPQVAGLLAGDISGIQNFIYAIHHPKKATAVLRARSFYIQMLGEIAARFILRKLELPITNALYVGGGGFTLIVPPLEEEKIAEISRAINSILLRAHGGDLYLALGYAPMSPRNFGRGSLSRIYDQLQTSLDDDKAHRFAKLSVDELKRLFAPQGGESESVCSICGREAKEEELESKPEEGEEEINWCSSCVEFRKLGDKLRRASYLRISEIEANPGDVDSLHTWKEVFRALGFEIAIGVNPPASPAGAVRSVLFGLTDDAEPIATTNTAIGHRFLVNVVPQRQTGESLPTEKLEQEIKPGDTKHFGVLARQSQRAPYLGVLRMDMDNLGKIFSRGLGEKYDSLSRRATLSLLLSVFFEGWVGKIAADMANEKEQERLYSVYSGGDDLFFVGSWDATIELARRIRSDLGRFTARSDLGISGGLILVHEKYPLYVAAEDAKKAENSAKNLRKRKDAFCFIHTPVPWERFGYNCDGDTVAAWAKALCGLVQNNKGNRAILRVLQDLYLSYRHEKDTRGPMGPWVWHAAYWFARAQKRNEGKKEFVDRIEELKQLLSGKNFANNIEWLALAARWAELATRKEENRAK